jgi:hypothetical protein
MWQLLALHIALESTSKDAAARIIIKVLHIALESTSKDTAARIIIKFRIEFGRVKGRSRRKL